jgi:hypothetical protein
MLLSSDKCININHKKKTILIAHSLSMVSMGGVVLEVSSWRLGGGGGGRLRRLRCMHAAGGGSFGHPC